MKKIICFVMAMILALSLFGCSSSNNVEDTSVSTPSEAINAVQSVSNFSSSIAVACNFSQYAKADVATTDATLSTDNESYIVTIRGSMLGTTDAYGSEFAIYKFDYVRKVYCSDGSMGVPNITINKG